MQGYDVVVGLDSIETDLGVEPLHSRPVPTDDEATVDALLTQLMLETDISRLESIHGAIESVSFDAMKVRLEIRKKVETVVAPQLLTDIFNKMHQSLSRPDKNSNDWLLPSRSQPQTKPKLLFVLEGNVRLYHDFKGYKLFEGQTNHQAWREKMDIGT